MTAIEQVFNFYGEQTVEKLRQSFAKNNVNASGALSNSVESKVVRTGKDAASLQVSMFRYGLTAEDGRKPTEKGTKPGKLFARIRKWIDDKGISVPEKEKKGMAYAITKKIHKEGTLRYKEFKGKEKGSGVISDVINEDLIDEIVSEVADQTAKEVADGLAAEFTNRTEGRNVSS